MASNTFNFQHSINDSAFSESELSCGELLALEAEIENQSDSDFFDLDNEQFIKNEEQILIKELIEEDFDYDSPHPFAEDNTSFYEDSESSSESTDEDTSTFKQQIRLKKKAPSKTTEIIISNISKPPMLASWKVVERPFGIIDGQSTKCIAATSITSRSISSGDDKDDDDLNLEDFIHTNDLDNNTSYINESKSYLAAPLFAFRNRNTPYFTPSQTMRRRKSSTSSYSHRKSFISKSKALKKRRKSSSAVLELNIFDDLEEDDDCLSPLFGELL